MKLEFDGKPVGESLRSDTRTHARTDGQTTGKHNGKKHNVSSRKCWVNGGDLYLLNDSVDF